MSLNNVSPKTVKIVLLCVLLFVIYMPLAAIYHLPDGIMTNFNESGSIASAWIVLICEKLTYDKSIRNKKPILFLYWGIPLIHAIFWWNMSARWHFNPKSFDVMIVTIPEWFIIPLLLLKIDTMITNYKHKHRIHYSNTHL